MGLHFGNLGVKVRGLVTVRLSPYEQNPFAGMVSHGFPNMVRRVREEFFYVIPPFALGYMVYAWAERAHERSHRKNPGEDLCGKTE